MAIKDKEQELKRKLLVKQNLKKIQSQVDDQRFTNIEEYIKTLKKVQEDFYKDPLSKHINMKTVIRENKNLTRREKNRLFHLHNTASEDETYGLQLYNYCLDLHNQGKVDKDFASQIYVLSVDWPLDFAIEFISKDDDLDLDQDNDDTKNQKNQVKWE